jgi:ATP-binding cassette, subfamily A (ABC1), member 3
MDPFKRRQTWDLLLKHKAGRTIMLSTHFMGESAWAV